MHRTGLFIAATFGPPFLNATGGTWSEERCIFESKELVVKCNRFLHFESRKPAANRIGSNRRSESRKVSGLRSPFQRYSNVSDEGADRVVLTQAAGQFESAGQQVAGRDFLKNAISIKSTVEMAQQEYHNIA